MAISPCWVNRHSVANRASRYRPLPTAILALSLASSAAANSHKKESHRLIAYATTSACALGTGTDARAHAATPRGDARPSGKASGVGAWLSMVSRTQAEQPHWITPLVTVTPRLEQEVRYDFSWQEKLHTATGFYGGGKGFELIPSRKLEVIFGIPSYNAEYSPSGKRGFADETLLVKYRLFESNEHTGNQILTFFLGASLPTGSAPFSSNHAIITPTVAYGKGFKGFDVQSTLGIGLPTAETGKLGRMLVWNSALQHHSARFLWPELEFNFNSWYGGVRSGKNQLYLTPGVVFGRVPLRNRLGLTVGVGLQVAATHYHTYNHAVVVSFRLPF